MLCRFWLFVTPWTIWPAMLLCPWISWARILKWVAISYSRGSSWPRDQTCISYVSCIGRQILYHCTPWKAWRLMDKLYQYNINIIISWEDLSSYWLGFSPDKWKELWPQANREETGSHFSYSQWVNPSLEPTKKPLASKRREKKVVRGMEAIYHGSTTLLSEGREATAIQEDRR